MIISHLLLFFVVLLWRCADCADNHQVPFSGKWNWPVRSRAFTGIHCTRSCGVQDLSWSFIMTGRFRVSCVMTFLLTPAFHFKGKLTAHVWNASALKAGLWWLLCSSCLFLKAVCRRVLLQQPCFLLLWDVFQSSPLVSAPQIRRDGAETFACSPADCGGLCLWSLQIKQKDQFCAGFIVDVERGEEYPEDNPPCEISLSAAVRKQASNSPATGCGGLFSA